MKTTFRDWANRQPKSGLPAVLVDALGHDDTTPDYETVPEGVTADGEVMDGAA